MFNWELIFRRKEHYITIPQRQSRRLYFGNDHLYKILQHQQDDENIFITKYAEDGIVSCIILDFDDKDNPANAFHDAKKLRKWTKRNGLNTVIIQSGSKGYHCYVQLPYRAFGNAKYNAGVDRDIWFNKFTEFIIHGKKKIKYPTLDMTNTMAGLRGNIRVIGSKHPKTQNICEIVEGEFLEEITPNQYEWDCLQRAYEYAKGTIEVEKVNRQNMLKEIRQKKYDTNPIFENDLRILMPHIFGGDVKTFKKGYIMMQCPFHNDSNPSMYVDKEKYYCKSCGSKGNWWTLRKLGYVDFEEEDYIRISKQKKVKI